MRCDVPPGASIVARPKEMVVPILPHALILQCPAHARGDQAHVRFGLRPDCSWETEQRKADGKAADGAEAMSDHETPSFMASKVNNSYIINKVSSTGISACGFDPLGRPATWHSGGWGSPIILKEHRKDRERVGEGKRVELWGGRIL